jgi:hypothetical protein
MLEIDLYINDDLILLARAQRLEGDEGGACNYHVTVESVTKDGKEHQCEFQQEHNYIDGAEVLARKILDTLVKWTTPNPICKDCRLTTHCSNDYKARNGHGCHHRQEVAH